MVFDQEGVLADKIIGEFVHGGLDGQRAAFDNRFAPADDALIGFDLQKQPARRDDIGGQFGDLHGNRAFVSLRVPIGEREPPIFSEFGYFASCRGGGEVAFGEVENSVDAIARRCRVAQAQGLHHLAMQGNRFPVIRHGEVRRVKRKFQGGMDGAGEAMEDLVVARLEKHGMEEEIGLGEGFGIVACRLHALPGSSRSAISWARRAACGIFGGSRLDRAARFEDARQQVEVAEMRPHPLQHILIEDVPFVLIADGGADARLAAYKPLGFQDLQGFADDGAADAMEVAKVVFARQQRTGGVPVGADILGNRRRDVTADARPALAGAAVFSSRLAAGCIGRFLVATSFKAIIIHKQSSCMMIGIQSDVVFRG